MAGNLSKNKIILDTTDLSDSDNVGAYLRDSAGNLITSQVNGSQQALDVGINVAGVQIDPRQIRALTSADVVTVDQGTSPWVNNITQFGGNNVVTGTGASGVGIPRVTVANDSNILVTQSTSPWITSDLADGSPSGGTAATKSALAGGIYNSTPPTLTNGQQASLQLDSSGNLLVDLAKPLVVNVEISPPDSSVKNSDVAVTNSAAKLLSAELAARKNMFIYNNSNKPIYVGKDATVTSSTGFPIQGNSSMSIDLGPDVSLYAIGTVATTDVRVLEFA